MYQHLLVKVFQTFDEFLPGIENQKSSPSDSMFFNFANYTELIDKSAEQRQTPTPDKARELLEFFGEGNISSLAVTNCTNSLSEIEKSFQDDVFIEEILARQPNTEKASVTIKLTSEEGCKRCKALEIKAENKVTSADHFYCDCGMRAVMRRLRQEILSDLDFGDLIYSQDD